MNNPALYTTVNDLQRRDARDFSDEFSYEISEMSGHCLDIGSGPGDIVVDFILPKLDTEATLVCSDISEKMVNFGKEKYKNNKRLSFVKLDIESPNLPEDLTGKFDHITSFYCLHFCYDMRRVFENIFDILRPGGTIFLTFVANSPGMNSYKELAVMPCYQPYMKDADRYISAFQDSDQPRQNLIALVRDVGFEVHHCSVREKSYTFDNPDIWSKFVLAVNPFIDRIPADLTEKYLKDLVNEFTSQNSVFKKNDCNKDEYSILYMYYTFMVYLKKPSVNNKGYCNK